MHLHITTKVFHLTEWATLNKQLNALALPLSWKAARQTFTTTEALLTERTVIMKRLFRTTLKLFN
jgi:hypothetical protein